MVHVLNLQLAARDVEDFSDALWRLSGILGIQECPIGAEGAGFFEVREDFEFLEFGSEAAEKCAEWLEADAYRGNGELLLRVHFENDELANEDACRNAILTLETGTAFEILSILPVQDVDYLEEYRKSVRGQTFGGAGERKLWIGPPWDTPPEGVEAFVVEPGLAFGTGDHPTTQMCLASLDRLRASGARPRSFLDLGTGSGVLSAGVARFFPGARIVATDLDPLCAQEVEKTLRLNSLAPNVLEGRFGGEGDTRQLLLREERFDVVVSNIYAEVLVKLLPDIARMLNPQGLWILSGVLGSSAFETLEAQALRQGFRLERKEFRELERARLGRKEGLTRHIDTWYAAEFRKI